MDNTKPTSRQILENIPKIGFNIHFIGQAQHLHIVLYTNIRHSQHHVGWMNSMLARKTGKSAKWVI